ISPFTTCRIYPGSAAKKSRSNSNSRPWPPLSHSQLAGAIFIMAPQVIAQTLCPALCPGLCRLASQPEWNVEDKAQDKVADYPLMRIAELAGAAPRNYS